MRKGNLYVLAIPIGGLIESSLPQGSIANIHSLKHFIAERAKTCRKFLKEIKHPVPLQEIQVFELDKHEPHKEIDEMLTPVFDGENMGLLSEAGAAGVLDAGTLVVERAHTLGIPVSPLVGPSSFLLALMASGLGGQQFQVLGYLSPKQHDLRNDLRRWEKESARKRITQICIETPYRNRKLFEAFCTYLNSGTRLCVAAGLTTPDEFILTRTISEWKKLPPPPIHKIPTVFLFLSQPE